MKKILIALIPVALIAAIWVMPATGQDAPADTPATDRDARTKIGAARRQQIELENALADRRDDVEILENLLLDLVD